MEKVLLINEDKKFSDFLKHILESSGIETEQLEDPFKVFDRIKESPPALIILDLNFDFVDGLYLIEKIMLNSSNPKMPILVVSQTNAPLYLFDALERGAVDFIAVPIDEEQLISKVKKIIPDKVN